MTGAFGPGGPPVATNGITPVAVVTAPGASKQRQALSVAPRNRDTVPHIYTLQRNKASTIFYLAEVYVDAGKTGQLISNCYVVAGTDDSLEVLVDKAATTTESEVDVSYFEVP